VVLKFGASRRWGWSVWGDEGCKLPDIAKDAVMGADTALDFLGRGWIWAETAEEGLLW